MFEELPYIIKERIVRDYKYNPNYGDDRVCKCGHPYYRHFDTYEEMFACGCKYCNCYRFKELGPNEEPQEDIDAGDAPEEEPERHESFHGN